MVYLLTSFIKWIIRSPLALVVINDYQQSLMVTEGHPAHHAKDKPMGRAFSGLEAMGNSASVATVAVTVGSPWFCHWHDPSSVLRLLSVAISGLFRLWWDENRVQFSTWIDTNDWEVGKWLRLSVQVSHWKNAITPAMNVGQEGCSN